MRAQQHACHAPAIAALGTITIDLTACLSHLPAPGETIPAHGFRRCLGGKALNQAVAVQRLGGSALLAGAVGSDAFGLRVRRLLAAEGVNQDLVQTVHDATGICLIAVETGSGENNIITIPAANNLFTANQLDWLQHPLSHCHTLMLHWDLPRAVGERLIANAKAHGKKVVLSLAPYGPICDSALAAVDVLAVNEVEAGMLCGLDMRKTGAEDRALASMADMGIAFPVITLGSRGAAALADGKVVRAPAMKVKAVDTVAAGDTLIGSLTRFLQVLDKPQALQMAVWAASLAVTREGASESIPTHDQLMKAAWEERGSLWFRQDRS